MRRNILNDAFKNSLCRILAPRFAQRESAPRRNFTQLLRYKICERKNPWSDAISVRTKKSSKIDKPVELFYKDVKRGFIAIAAFTFLYVKCMGWILLTLQIAPFLYLFRQQLPVIGQMMTRDLKLMFNYFKTVAAYNTYESKNVTLYKCFEEVAKKHPRDFMFHFAGKQWSYSEMLNLVNKLALYFHKKGLDKGDAVGLLMTNRPEYVALILGFSRLGTVTCPMNTNMRRAMLLTRIQEIRCKHLIVSQDLVSSVNEIKETLQGNKIKVYLYDGKPEDKSFVDLQEELLKLKEDEELRLQYRVGLHDRLMYSSSGTMFGYSLASVVTNAKFIFTALAATEFLGANRTDDVIYSVLPFYKAENIATSIGPAIVNGVPAVVKKDFSAEDYFRDCALHRCTLAQYGGEMGKHLSARPHSKFDKTHRIRFMFGKGMHQNIWAYMEDRFNVRIVEYYGTTTGNIYLVNINSHRGACGYLPKFIPPLLHPYQLIRVQMHNAEPIRMPSGCCERVENYETGVLVGRITHRPDSQFKGCKMFKDDGGERDMIRNVVFKGDKAYLTGDTFMRDKFGYMYPQGHGGDNFTWDSENISVSEVEKILAQTAGIKSFIFYGVRVPNTIERVGMLMVEQGQVSLDFNKFLDAAKENLPPYSVPALVRVTDKIPVPLPPSTVDRIRYEDEGYDPRKLKDALFYLNRKTNKYEQLTADVYRDITVDKILL